MTTVDTLAAELRERVGERYLLGLTGCCGAGKSTLAEALAARVPGAVVVPMDGFHRPNAELEARGLMPRKGSPPSFDAAAFVALLRRLRRRPPEVVLAPRYDRALHEPVPEAIRVPADAPLVLVEGNYLLLGDPPWAEVCGLLDAVWFLDLPPAEAVERVRRRHRLAGRDEAEIDRRIRCNDQPNAELIWATRHRADRLVQLAAEN